MFRCSACRRQNRYLVLVEELVKQFCSIYWQNPQITAAVLYFQKQPPEVLCKKMCSLKVRKWHRKMPTLESVFNKVQGLRACKFVTKILQHRCFPVEFAKFLRIPILKNICERLFLYLYYNSHHHFHFHRFHYHQKRPFADVLQNRYSGVFL